jgi:hypothetical protein
MNVRPWRRNLRIRGDATDAIWTTALVTFKPASGWPVPCHQQDVSILNVVGDAIEKKTGRSAEQVSVLASTKGPNALDRQLGFGVSDFRIALDWTWVTRAFAHAEW